MAEGEARNSRFDGAGLGPALTKPRDRDTLLVQSPRAELQNPPDLNARNENASAQSKEILRMLLLRSNASASAVGLDLLPGKVNYYNGNDANKWYTEIPTYSKVKFQGVYPGVDLVYYGDSGNLEYNFVLAPGADPSRIRLAVTEGDPSVRMVGSNAKQEGRRPKATGSGRLRVDRNGDLVTTLGGGGAGIGVDSSGNAYIIGSAGAGGSEKIFVVGLNPQGNAILYTTYLSGSSGSGPGGIAVDSQGDAYITGTAGPGFPTTVGAYMASCSNGCGIFAAKLLPAGELGYSAILGGSNASGRAIAIDGSGAAYITGTISSADLPVVNAFQPSYAGMLCTGCSNAFVQKLDPTGSQLSYSTYLGGGFGNYGYATTEASGVAVDAAGNAYVVGATESPLFPVKNALEASLNSGFGNAFLTKFTPDGTALIYSTYLGGSGTSVNTFADSAAGVAVDSAGNVYVTGNTVSRDFPLTMNAYKASCVESALETCQSSQIYVLDIDPSGASLVYSTLLGTGAAGGVAVDSSSGAWVTGVTASNYYPVVGAVQSSLQQVPFSNTDTFVTHLSSAGIPTFSTYLGGSYTEVGGERWDSGRAEVGNKGVRIRKWNLLKARLHSTDYRIVVRGGNPRYPGAAGRVDRDASRRARSEQSRINQGCTTWIDIENIDLRTLASFQSRFNAGCLIGIHCKWEIPRDGIASHIDITCTVDRNSSSTVSERVDRGAAAAKVGGVDKGCTIGGKLRQECIAEA